MDNTQLQFEGFLNTPLLWNNHDVMGLFQLDFPIRSSYRFEETVHANLRLGKRVERFVSKALDQNENIDILQENTQIKKEKITIGEIDCILRQDGIPIHLEIVYKFYLYDPSVGTSEIEHWIGPNRKDSLKQKLYKLKDKQLPLIYKIQAKGALDAIQVKTENLIQRVYFKAQLFTPVQADHIDFKLLNKDCLKGFYIKFTDLDQVAHGQFFVPSKADWLIEVHSRVDWISFLQFKKIIGSQIHEKRAPLCWIQYPDGVISKFFVVWW